MWIGGVRAVILDDDGRVLLVRQHHDNKDIWMVPGGGIEAGENSVEAAVREVKEETGLDVIIEKLLWHVQEVSEKRGQRFVNFFLAKPTGGTLGLGSDPERSDGEQVLKELRFMSRAEIEQIENLYPEYIRDELWRAISTSNNHSETFKLRKL